MERDIRGLVQGFSLFAIVDGEPVEASLGPAGLACSENLFARADLLVRLGDNFETQDRDLPASLTDSPLQALLTLIRVCDRVLRVAVDAEASAGNGGPHP